ncbi:MAG: glycosyltransferase, partial [Desulfosudaceae bacterium]
DLKLLYVGRISREKNLQVLASVMRKIRQVRNDVALIVVVEGPYLEEMQAELVDLPVIFTGYLSGDALAQAYASSDIFLFPSTVDTMGNVVVEAQASGVPVIVTDKGGPSENMIDQETGYVVTADDRLDEHMAEAALRLVNDSCLLAGMKKNARAYARDRSFENSFLAFWNNYP